jgi:hypothetical protein
LTTPPFINYPKQSLPSRIRGFFSEDMMNQLAVVGRLPPRWLMVAGLVAAALLSASAARSRAQTVVPKDLDPDHAAKMAKGLALFKKSIKPLIESKCLRCHGGVKVESELDLSDRDSLVKGGLHGPAVVPGKSKDSLLLKLVRHEKDPFMPKSGTKLPDDAIAQLAAWIDLGAPYDNPLVAAKAKRRSWTEKVLEPEAKRWWSFQPLKKVAPPPLKNQAWAKTPLDSFVFAKLDAAGLAPNPPASKHVLIRRAYFDLLGLPPPLEEVDAFVNDTSPDAWPRLIQRLLSSPHYGERWGRHWLDLARFAESHGFEHDYDRPTAYHYRDFVIEALNRDMPYDQFVKWQIAGDEYAPGDNLALKATGFLAAGVHSTQITKSEVEKHRYDEMDDKLNTLSTAMLGLTVGCARCHDHKYDPIPARDYYRMLASFTTTIRSEVDLDVDPEGYKKAKVVFDREHQPFADALRKYEADSLPSAFQAWRESVDVASLPWEVPEIKDTKSKEGATLTVQPDGAVLAEGKNGKYDVYTILVHTRMKSITAVRLEALSHPSLVKGGPGRAANGNFALSDLKVTAAPLDARGANPPRSPVKLNNPRATFEQKGLPVAAAVDKDAKSAWAVDPQFGKDHAAAFEFEQPVGFDSGTALTFTLSFNTNDMHNLGRLRLSLTSAAAPPLTTPGIPTRVREALTANEQQRTPEQLKAALAWYRTQNPTWQNLEHARLEHLQKAPKPSLVKALIASEGLPPVRLHSQGEDFFNETYFLRRGDPDNKEGVASQGFLQVLMPSSEAQERWRTPPPKDWRTSYRRRALAEWLTDVEHGAGALLARVIVNRLWQHHLGRGIVATPSDFGTRGEPPTHPELLDYLAQELIKNNWRLKPIHQLIMTSAVYQQSSAVDETKAKVDRDNKLLWRNPSRRLEAEVIRDALLAVSGQLDPKLYGPGTFDEASKRRSIYFTVKRSKLMPMMVIFDAPEALSGMAERPTTTIAPQALHLLNNPRMRDYAKGLAQRAAPAPDTKLEAALRAAYKTALAREPSAAELTDGIAFVEEQMTTYSGADRRERALADLCQVLMCLNEFVYVD